MTNKCNLCLRKLNGCICCHCKKSTTCKHAIDKDCRITYSCGKFELFDSMKEIYKAIERCGKNE